MNRVRLTYIIATILCLAVIGGGFAIGISPLLTAAAAANMERVRIEADNSVLETRLTQLGQTRDELEQHRARLNELHRAIPTDGAYDAYLDEIYELARVSGVAIDRVTFGDAAPIGTPAGEAPAPADPGASDPAAEPTDPAATDPAPTDTAAPADPATGAATTAAPGGLLSIPVQVGVTGPGAGVQQFVDAVQNADRYTLVTKVSLASEEDAGDVLGVEATALLDGFVWALPE
ncbi:hypothetical protein [Microbacterium rhizophilus]|uniref:hypothetical protein n=1 Tax=Microbacterium rhizophilus TaxID=3138934 RepID=UPI0031EC2971